MSFDEQAADEACRKKLGELIEILEQNRGELDRQGLDAEKQIQMLRTNLVRFDLACAAKQRALEQILQANADVADAELRAFEKFSALVDNLLATYPDDPQVKDWAQERDRLAKAFPPGEI